MNLEVLKNLYPLDAARWEEIESFEDEFVLGDSRAFAVGLVANDKDHKQQITASAVDLSHERACQRAYFELVERTSLIQSPKSVLTPSTQTGFTFSKSNGVAAGNSLKDALESAHNEILERDSLLKSWYGHLPVEKVASSKIPGFLDALSDQYEIGAYRVQDTYIIAGLPFSSHNHLTLYGYARKANMDRSLSHAALEFLQRYYFLKDEDYENVTPDLSKNGMDLHMEAFLTSWGVVQLKKWIGNEFFKNEKRNIVLTKTNEEEFYVDLTPDHLLGKCCVVQARMRQCVPLGYGLEPAFIENISNLSPVEIIHPFT